MPAFAGKDYELKIDRFDDTKAATYDSEPDECKILKSYVDRLSSCVFLHFTEAGGGVSMASHYVSESWELLDYRSFDEAKVIITFSNDKIRKQTLPIKHISGDVLSGTGKVFESIWIDLGSIKDVLTSIKQIEFQIGSHEYMWRPDPVLTKKALNFEQ